VHSLGVEAKERHTEGFTLKVKRNGSHGRFVITDTGKGLTSRGGLSLVAEVAEVLDVAGALEATVGHARPTAKIRPGTVLRDVSLMLVDGGFRLRHIGTLRGQSGLFDTVPSTPTVSRTIAALADHDVDSMVCALDQARAQVRAAAWAAGGAPPVVKRAAAGRTGLLTIDLDATLVIAHSDDKHGAAPTYKRTFGFHPMTAWLDRQDGTGEALAIDLRPGNAGSNTVTDSIQIVDRALGQLPTLPDGLGVLVRSDAAGATHGLTDHLRARGVLFSVGMPLQAQVKDAIRILQDDPQVWVEALRQDGTVRPGAAVVEATGLVDLTAWPSGSRLLVRREPLHAGAQQTIDDIDGHRFTAWLTDQTGGDLAFLDVTHRAHARVEDRIRCAKDTGLDRMVCDTFDRNQIWCQLVALACDLVCFTQALTLDGDLAKAEPRLLRYALWHVAGQITTSGRTRQLNLASDWPWTARLLDAFDQLRQLPAPGT
jgi:hypothetical protein